MDPKILASAQAACRHHSCITQSQIQEPFPTSLDFTLTIDSWRLVGELGCGQTTIKNALFNYGPHTPGREGSTGASTEGGLSMEGTGETQPIQGQDWGRRARHKIEEGAK